MHADYEQQLQELVSLQHGLQDMHPCLRQHFPIAVMDTQTCLIYDWQAAAHAYRLMKKVASPLPDATTVWAAFPLEDYDGRMACVVTEDVFSAVAGSVTILHEFVHCYQFAHGEQALKQQLRVAQQAMAAGDVMWELEHPFPYSDPAVAASYAALLSSTTLQEMLAIHQELKALLSGTDYEYLIWQEWKEGLARYIENRMRQRLGLPDNRGGAEPPFERRSFYAGGARFIALLAAAEPAVMEDICRLFGQMLGAEAAARQQT